MQPLLKKKQKNKRSSRARCEPPDIRAPHVELTPLVDITFQVLIFLLVVNDLAAKVQEDVELPFAENVTEVQSEDGTVTVNVLAPAQLEDPPRIRVGGRVFDVPALTDALRAVADLHRPALDPDADTRAGVLIRADRGAPWRHVQLVLQACADQGVRIRRVQLATDSEGTSLSPGRLSPGTLSPEEPNTTHPTRKQEIR